MSDVVKLRAKDTGEIHEFDKETALTILKNDGRIAKGKPKKKNWQRVTENKTNKSDSKRKRDTGAPEQAEKSGATGGSEEKAKRA